MLVLPRLPGYKVGDIKRVDIFPDRVVVYWVMNKTVIYIRREDGGNSKTRIAERKMP